LSQLIHSIAAECISHTAAIVIIPSCLIHIFLHEAAYNKGLYGLANGLFCSH